MINVEIVRKPVVFPMEQKSGVRIRNMNGALLSVRDSIGAAVLRMGDQHGFLSSGGQSKRCFSHVVSDMDRQGMLERTIVDPARFVFDDVISASSAHDLSKTELYQKALEQGRKDEERISAEAAKTRDPLVMSGVKYPTAVFANATGGSSALHIYQVSADPANNDYGSGTAVFVLPAPDRVIWVDYRFDLDIDSHNFFKLWLFNAQNLQVLVPPVPEESSHFFEQLGLVGLSPALFWSRSVPD